MPRKKKPSNQVISFRVTAEEKELIKKAAAMIQENNPEYVDSGGTVPVIRRFLVDGFKHVIQTGGAATPGKDANHDK